VALDGELGFTVGPAGGWLFGGDEFSVALDVPASTAAEFSLLVLVQIGQQPLDGVLGSETFIDYYGFLVEPTTTNAIGQATSGIPIAFDFDFSTGDNLSAIIGSEFSVELLGSAAFAREVPYSVACDPWCKNAVSRTLWRFQFPSQPEAYSARIRVSPASPFVGESSVPEPALNLLGALGLIWWALLQPRYSQAGRNRGTDWDGEPR
jgi:hypothetical protein